MLKAVHYFKQWLKKILPRALVARIIRAKGEKLKMIDLSCVAVLREADKHHLKDIKFLENELLPRLGFNDERLHEFPEELHPFTGRGLLHWQYPNQFSKYLVKLSDYKIGSYLEIGVRHGGTFIITVEYLRRFNPVTQAIGIDISYPPGLVAYGKTNKSVQFLQLNSLSDEFSALVAGHRPFDLVLIDGNHEEDICRKDFYLVKDRANIIVLHDIASDVCPGVRAVWREIRTEFAEEYHFFEFTDQYASVMKREGKSFLGIGMAVRKSFSSS